jgi:hypothetical protein
MRLPHYRRWPLVLDRRCDRERNGGRGEDELGDEHHGIEMGDKQVDGELDQGFFILVAREGGGQ